MLLYILVDIFKIVCALAYLMVMLFKSHVLSTLRGFVFYISWPWSAPVASPVQSASDSKSTKAHWHGIQPVRVAVTEDHR
jgi:hypothetical protein